MRWEIMGCEKSSGVDRSIVIECDTRAAAEHRANELGLLVSSVEPIPDRLNDTPISLDYHSPAQSETARPGAHASRPVAMSSSMASTLLGVAAGVAVFAGAIVILLGGARMFIVPKEGFMESIQSGRGAWTMFAGFLMIVAGFILMALGEILTAIRQTHPIRSR